MFYPLHFVKTINSNHWRAFTFGLLFLFCLRNTKRVSNTHPSILPAAAIHLIPLILHTCSQGGRRFCGCNGFAAWSHHPPHGACFFTQAKAHRLPRALKAMQQNRVFFLLSKGVFLFLFPPFFGRHYKTLDFNKKGKSFPLFAQRYLTHIGWRDHGKKGWRMPIVGYFRKPGKNRTVGKGGRWDGK